GEVEGLMQGTALERANVEGEGVPEPARAAAREKREEIVRLRIRALAKRAGVPLDPEKLSLEDAPGSAAADLSPTEAAILAFLHSEEFIGELPASPADAAQKVAAALAAFGPGADKAAFAGALGKALERAPDDAAIVDLAASIDKPVREILKRQ